jgi:PAS domain S-box-containing protein
MNISFALSVMEEEAQHQLADAAVLQSEARFKSLIQTAPVVILNLSPDGAILEFNPEAERVYGRTRKEVLGKNFFDLFISVEKRIRMADNLQKVLGGEPIINFEMPTRRADGSQRLFIWNVDRLLDNKGAPSGIIAIGSDITERKQMEKALQESEEQLRYLSASLMAAQEDERKRIAREIHDELGQALTVLKLRLRSVEKRLRKNQVALREDCENLLQYTDEIVKIVRRISRELTPSILEDLGFTAAVRWLVDSFRKDQAIKIALDTADINNLLVKDAQIVVYRILQEALNNITKHAQAQHVAVLIREFENKLLFCVEDDGKGFDMEQVSERDPTERGLGLKTMHERALMVNGSLDLVSQEGKGTRITLSIPIAGTGRR